eukprot:scaffold73841_cov52-Phaeocystis_antarctica.AAC.3
MRGEVWAGGGRAWAGGSARAACTGRGPDCEGGGGYGACAERTENMPYMVVTLDMSKPSGWLNAAAFCRVEKDGVRCGARCGPGGEGVGRRQRTSGMHGKRARL